MDSVSLYLDGTLGGDDAASKENAEKMGAACVYACVCHAWLLLWTFVCTGTGNPVWIKLQGDDFLDHFRTSL